MQRKILSCVYEIRNTRNNKRYIGSTVNFKRRIGKHKWALKNNIHKNKALQRDYNYYGADVFEYKILKKCKPSQLKEYEQDYIDLYLFDCYNRKAAVSQKRQYERYLEEISFTGAQSDEILEPLIDDYDWELYKEGDPNLSDQ